MARDRAEAAGHRGESAGSGEGGSAGAVSGGSAGAFGLDYGMCCRPPHGGQSQQRDRRRRGKAGQRAERAAYRARVMFGVLVGRAARFTMADKQHQQTPLGATDLDVGTALVRRLEYLGEAEGKMNRHQRIER